VEEIQVATNQEKKKKGVTMRKKREKETGERQKRLYTKKKERL